MRKRLIILSVCFALLLVAGIGRLASIILIEGEEYKEIASKQSKAMVSGVSTRGNIYDRNGNYLTGMEESLVYLIEKRKMDDKALSLLKEVDAQEVNNSNERYNIYSTCNLNKDICERLCNNYGALVMKTRQRYSDSQPAIHIIGYVNQFDKTGACGIERDYDSLLSSVEKIYYGQTDGQGYLIPGLGIRVEGGTQEWGVVTTLDLDIQRVAEEVLADTSEDGAIIVTEALSGDILASASSPVYSPHQVEEYLESNEREFLNKSMKCLYPPGSIFKIIVMAAALEQDVVTPETCFVCEGYHEISGLRIKCSTGGAEGHGEITLKEAFSCSCNAIFVQLGQMVGADAILEKAKEFGILEESVAELSGQSAGNLPLLEESLGAGIGNLSIGQGKLLMTPMHVARITQIIANDGMDTGLSLVDATIEGIKGTVLLPNQTPKRVISRKTAKAIKEMMAVTVLNGTADNLIPPEGITVAGKTGSAEATIGEGDTVHSWFTGFAPVDNPQYVITVFVENGGSGRKTAVPIFNRMLNAIYE